MKKIMIALLVASSFMVNANNEKTNKKETKKEDVGTCTVSIGTVDNDGNVRSASGTGATCSEARANAEKNLKTVTASIQ